MSTYETIDAAAQSLLKYCNDRDYSGYDPYDALNSPLLRLATLGLKYPRIAVTQGVKKLPWNLRPLFLIPKGHNPKGLGLFLWSHAKLYSVSTDEQQRAHHAERTEHLMDLLESIKGTDNHGNGWGYNFPWQSRAFFVPRYTPTIVNSCFIGHALLDVHRITGSQRALDMALPIKDFILKDLNRTPHGDAFCFSYTPIDELIVHNANMLGASLLIRLNQHEPNSEMRDAAHASLAYSMQHQRDDGSWWYADTDYQKWIDSFHTGFNLQCLQYFMDLGETPEYQQAYKSGTSFYADNFFLDDGTAKYFHDRTYPIDVHSYAQAMVFFSHQGERYRELVDQIAKRFIDTFRDDKGFFYFQQRPNHVIKIPYMRWSQSWSLHALTDYLAHHPRQQSC
ncbi:MAG: hypothetical protein WBD31_12390 [Rubripirellula sp.]